MLRVHYVVLGLAILLYGCGDRPASPPVATGAASTQFSPAPEKAVVKAPPDSLVAHGVWKCDFRIKGKKTIAELALFPDGYFLMREQDAGKSQERLVAGSYKIGLDGRSFTQTIKAARSARDTDGWHPALQAAKVSESPPATREFELSDYSDSSLNLKPVRWASGDGKDAAGIPDGEPELCKKDNQLLPKFEALRKEIPVSLMPEPAYVLGSGPENGKMKGDPSSHP